MPAISKIRFCNVSYENGAKRYNDQLFHFDGQNSAILLENGGGKTVFIQTVLQCIIPHVGMAERKIKDTLFLEQGPAHIAIEWIINEQPRRYGLTCVSLFIENNQLNSLKYTYEYSGSDDYGIEELPFKIEVQQGQYRPATKGEIGEFYQRMARNYPFANAFATIQDYSKHIENQFKIIPSEWKKVAIINSGEGNVDEFFNRCKTTEQLLNNLLIPVIEEAIEGENTAEFAKTFEKQQEHFKKNRILHDKIEQTKGVKEQIDTYVEVYKKFDTTQLKLNKIKERAASVATYLEQALQHIETEYLNLAQVKEQLILDEGYLQDQKISYQILQTEAKMMDKVTLLESLKERLKTLDLRRNDVGARRQNIQISKAKLVIKEIEEDINRLNEELALEEQSLPTEDIYIKLDELNKNIKGFFSYELESIRLEIGRKKGDLQQLVKEKEALNATHELMKVKEITLKDTILKREVHSELLDHTLNAYYDQLFENEIGCIVESYMEEWKATLQELEEKKQQATLQQKELNMENELCQEEMLTKKGQLTSLEKESLKINNQLINLRGLMHRHYDVLMKQGLAINTKDLIYTKEESILSFLHEKLDYLSTKKKRMAQTELTLLSKHLFKELVHPSMLTFYEQLKKDVDFITLGQQYLEQLTVSMNLTKLQLLEIYPFFAMTFVTNRKNKELIMTFLESHSDELFMPIIVLTMDEMSRILKKETETSEGQNEGFVFDNSILPRLWMDQVQLQLHNEAIAEELIQLKHEQEELQQKWITLHDLQHDMSRFFEEYSYRDYLLAIEEQKDIDKHDTQIRLEILEQEAKLNDVYEQQQQVDSLLTEIAQDYLELREKYEIGKNYLTTQEAYRLERINEETLRDDYSAQVQERKELDYQISVFEAEKQRIQTIIQEFSYEERRIIDLPLYKEVANLDAICANVDIQVLMNEKESLERRLLGLSSSRDILKLKIKDQNALLRHYEEQLTRLTKEAEFTIEPISVFYAHEEDALFDQFVELKKEIKQREKEIELVEKERFALETERSLLIKEMTLHHKKVIDFECDLKYIPTKIQVLEGTLRDTKRKMDKDEKDYREKRKLYEAQMTHMQIKDATYGFSLLEPMSLSKHDKLQLEQHRENYLTILFRELHEGHMALQQAKELVHEKRQAVITYCKEAVEDFRLKEAVMNGLMEKKELNDLLAYQERMSEIIHKTIQLANDDKRESDHELQTFLNHLLTYTQTVVNEFHILQKKTLIEFDSLQRQIFVFDIPELVEEASKEALRHYVDQMITLFEEEKGNSEETIRQLIEERLSIKNLLPVVLLQQPIKVKCRKVTNDLQINKAPMSWEYSNKWSGGEKWSKNMTLFLGILNYLAEKKQHLSVNQKKNRTVLLDNPFGKASSKHVLDPVFFIAERLGFQIIALTAHAEGQFISDYFPVVYSLRLRETDQVNKLLMTTERVLNYTYLKEKAPASVTRLQDAQQLQLF